MVTFIVLAAALTVAVAVLVAVPLLKRAPKEELAPAPWAALAAAGVLVIGSAVTYATLTNWSWRAGPAADSPQTMVARLARKLERNPDDLEGWLMLGRSYTILEQYPLAVRAFGRADRLSGGKSAEAIVGQAEALTMSDETQLDGRAGRLVEQALALDPNSGKALFFGAAAALRRGDLPVARERFVRLLAQNPPANVKPILEQQISLIDRKLASNSAQAGLPASTQAAAGQQAAASAQDAASTAEAAVHVKVVLSPTLPTAAADAPLFVFVRDPAQPGPPLAVKRLQSHFPQTVELTASDSMLPGRAFAAGQKVQVVARIARSGNPVAASGDPFGEVAYLVGRDGLVNVVIDRVTP